MKLLTRDDLKNRGIHYSNVHLLRLEHGGLFPRRVAIGGGRNVGWIDDEIDQYLAEAVARRGGTYANRALTAGKAA